MAKKKILVLGGTGAMGVYLVPELVRMGYAADVVSFDRMESDNPDLRYIQTRNAKDPAYIENIMKNDYAGVVDFMIYGTQEFKDKFRLFLDHTDHYIYLSSYRVYANEEHPIRETSPRLLDVATDPVYLASDDYSLHKARGEETLKASGYSNWSAIRPAITYSKRRFQLVTLEAKTLIPRAREGKKVLLPAEAMGVEATMSWAGDVAKMIARLLFNPAAYKEVFTVATSEHHTWETVAGYYKELIGMETLPIPAEEIYPILCDPSAPYYITARWQVELDRLYDRVIDNSKILTVAGMKQSELTTLYDGLKRELAALPKNVNFGRDDIGPRMDAYLTAHGLN